MGALFYTWTSLSWVVMLEKTEVAQKYGNVSEIES